ncbi:hypothetical protein DSCO28_33300 [Desulfosarcina ovata subsp. sediminis]|uniref:Glycosyl transferase family 1 domain-containing protein n=2 Tax=Desulfosarcina ovata TaxID=83564 RepID=A0A5K7ZMI3_9BACT|nr:hypothetical protein DSCO28_33300 [Desulfosarcina ovata subsp. sediminis]
MIRNKSIVPVGFDKEALYPISENRRNKNRSLLGYNDNDCVIVFCGSIAKFRRLDNLLKAFKIVVDQMDNARLLMIGDGNALHELKDLAYTLGIESKVQFTGRIEHCELVDYFGASDIGISYIPINENYTYNPPVKTFDYLSCSLPTIATQTISNGKIITDRDNGLLTSDSIDGVAISIIKLIHDDSMRKQIKQNARSSIMNYEFETIAEKHLIPVYESMLL